MTPSRLICAALFVTAFGGACDLVAPTNPFDPGAPPEVQAKGSITAQVVLVHNDVDGGTLERELGDVRVGLIKSDGERFEKAGGPLSLPLLEVTAAGGRLFVDELPPDTYTLVVEHLEQFTAPTIGAVAIGPGVNLDLGELTFVFVEGLPGTGTISGTVDFSSGSGTKTVKLFRAGAAVVEVASVTTEGAFAFTALGVGRYAVVASAPGFTSEYRLDIEIDADTTTSFVGGDALRLSPAAAVVAPRESTTTRVLNGVVFARGSAVDVDLRDGPRGATGVRLSTRNDFVDNGAALPFSTTLDAGTVTLPATDGQATVFAQFEARGTGEPAFIFTSEPFTATVLHDATAPVVTDDTAFRGLTAGDDGFFFVNGTSGATLVRLEANDATTGVAVGGFAVQETELPVPVGPTTTFDIASNGGLVRVDHDVVLDGDGDRFVYVFAADKAGNVSAPLLLKVHRDTTVPNLDVSVSNAVAGVLDSRLATLHFSDPAGGDDAPVAVQLGAPIGLDSEIVPFDFDLDFEVPGDLFEPGPLVVEARLIDRAGNEKVVTATSVTLSLRSKITGTVVAEGVPLVVADQSGATVRVLDANRVAVATAVTDATGGYLITGIPEGRGVFIEVARAGWTTTTTRLPALTTQSAADAPVAIDALVLPLARGNVSGIVRRGDLKDDLTQHANTLISLTLQSSDRTITNITASTSADGSFTVRDVPASRSDESWLVSAVRESYAGVTSNVVVVGGANAVVNPDANGAPVPLFLETDFRAFDVCAPVGACVPGRFFNTDSVRVRINNDEQVAAFRVRAGTAFTATDDAPAFVAYDRNADIVVDIGTTDGAVDVFLQVRELDGSVGDVLRVGIVRDTVAPTLINVSRVLSPFAFDDRFTNRNFVDLTIDGDAGAGTVAPLANNFVDLFADGDTPAAEPTADALSCVPGVNCRASLPGAETDSVDEDLFHLAVWNCDAAGNCSPPAETFVIHDVTPPSAANDVGFVLTGDLVQVGSEAVSRSPLYGANVDVGTARSFAGIDVVDENGDPVADVFATRFSRVDSTSDATIHPFTTVPAAGITSDDVIVPPLPAVDGSYRIFAQFIDAAGNRTAVEPNAFLADLRLDTKAPVVALVVAGGASSVSSPTFNVDIVVPSGGEVPTRVEFAADDGLFDPANTVSRNFPLAVGGESFTLPNRGDGNYVVVARVFDAAGNVVERSRTILLDTTAPDISFVTCTGCSENGGQFFSRSTTTTLSLIASDLSGVSQLEIEVEDANSGLATTQLVNFAGTVPVTLFANTRNIVTVRAIDRAGNATADSAVIALEITEDDRAPRILSATLADGNARTNATNVVFLVDAVDDETAVTRMQFAPTLSFGNATFNSFRAVNFVDLTGADGPKQVCVRVEDGAGNSATACDSVELDRVAPVGAIDVPVAVTRQSSVLANLTFAADTAAVAFAADAIACAAANYVAAKTSPQEITVDVGAVEGTVRIFACFKDAAGNFNATPASDTVIVDHTVPIVSVALDDGADFSLDENVAARVTVAPAADAVDLALAVDAAPNCNTAVFGAFAAVSSVALPLVDGTHTVFACVRDAAGNISAVAADSIVVDRTDPTGSVVIDGGALLTKNATVGLELTRAADVVSMSVSTAALNCATAPYEAFSSVRALTLGGLDGAKTVNVCLRDAAGRTVLVSDGITLDRRAPTASIAINNGAAITSSSIVNVAATFDSDATEMVLSPFPIDCNSSAFGALATSSAVDLRSNGGNATVFACFRDAAGNTTATSDNILVEQTSSGSLVVAINGADASTTTRNVTISLFAPADATQMKVAEAVTLDCDSPVGYVAFQSSSSLTLAAGGAAPAEGIRTVSACVKTSSATTLFSVDTILLDSFAPTGTVVINGGAAATARADVTLSIVKGANSDDVRSIGVASSSAAACQSFETFVGTRSFTLAGGDGVRSAFICLKDDGGNTTIISDDISLDTQAPSPVAVNVADFSTSTTATVALSFPAGDTSQVALAEGTLDCLSTNAYRAAATSLTVNLSASEGAKTIVACFKDAAGNTSQASDITTLDLVAPSGSVLVNDGAATTTSRSVRLTIAASADVSAMSIIESSTTPDCNTAVYTAFAQQPNFTVSNGDGTKTVQVCFEDRAGRRAAAVPDSIRLDQGAPSGSLAINGGALFTNRRDVSLSITRAVGSEDANEIAVGEGALACNAANLAFVAFQPTVAFTLSATDATKTVTLCLRDAAGNVNSANISSTIGLDTAPPSASTLSIANGANFTATGVVTLNLSFPSDVNGVAVANDGLDCSSATFVAPTATITGHVLTPGDGQKTVVACFRDRANNTFLATDGIGLDSVAPSAADSSVAINNGAAFANSRAVAVNVTAPADVREVAISEAVLDCDSVATVYSTLTSPVAFNIASVGDGVKTLRVCLRENAGRTVSLSDTIELDTARPVATAFTINGSTSPTTSSLAVTVNVTASADATGLALANGSLDCDTANYLPFAPAVQHTLVGTSPITVSLCLLDRAGNKSTTGANTRTVILDATPPSGSVSIENGAVSTTSRNVNLTINTTPAEVGASRAIANDGVECATATFVPVGSFPLTVAHTLSLGDGLKTVFVCFKDAAGNISVAQDSIVVDTADPVGTLAIVDPEGNNDGFANSRNLTLSLTLPNETTATSTVALREAAALDCTDPTLVYESFASTKPLLISATQGTHTIAACFKDAAGRVTPQSAVPTASIKLDDQVPTVSVFRLNGVNNPTVNNLVVTVQITASADVTQMSIGNTILDCSTATYSPFQSPSQFTVAGTSPITVSLCVKDAAGNFNDTSITRTVSVDTVAPVGTVVINNDAAFTQSRNVSLRLNTIPSENGAFRGIANDSIDCGTVAFTALGSSLPATVAHTLSIGDGLKTVFVCFRDATGNVSFTTDSISLDTIDPVGTITINDPEGNSDGFANTTSVTTSITVADEVTATTQMAVREAATLDCADPALVYEPFAPSKAVTLTNTQGPKTLAVCFKDVSGRVTPTASVATASINLDSVAPVATTYTINGVTSAVTNQLVVSVDIVASADTVSMALANGSLDCRNAFYGPFNSPVQHTLSGSSPVTVSLCLKDRAGNTSATGGNTRSVIIDQVAPSGSLSINAGAAFAGSRNVNLTLNTSPAEVNGSFAVFNDVADCSTATFAPLGSLPRTIAHQLSSVDGAKTVFVCYRDFAGNVSQAQDSIVVDTADPIGTIAIIDPENNNDGFINRTLFNIALTLPNENPATSLMSIKEGTTLDCAAGSTVYEPFSTSKSVQLVGSTQGIRNLVACFKDESGRTTPIAQVATVSTELDNIIPVVTDYTINNTRNPTVASSVVTIGLTTSADVVGMAIANGALDCSTATYTAFQSPVQHTIAGASPVTVSVCVKDRASNTSATGVNTQQVSSDPNAPTGSVTINDGDAFTTSNNVTLRITTTPIESGVTRAISNTTADCSDTTFAPLNAPETVAHTLLGGSGTKTVFVCFQDEVGNRSSSLDTITLDGDAPVGGLTILDPENDANEFTTTRNVVVSINLPGETAATSQMAIREANSINCQQGNLVFEPLAATKSIQLSTGDGLKKIVACFKDASGTTTPNDAVPSDTITLDTTPPTATLNVAEGSPFPVIGGTHFVNTTAVTASVSTTDSDLTGLTVTTASINCTTATIGTFTGVVPVTLPPGEGVKTITACLRDSAGLRTTVTKNVTLDTTSPAGTITLDAGAAFTADRGVVARVQSAETSGLRVKVPAVDCTGPFNIAAFDGDDSRTATIAGAEGSRAVGACLADAAGNATFISTTINLDLTAPTGISATCGSCTSVGGAFFTRGADLDSNGSIDAGILLGNVAAADTNANGVVDAVRTKVDLNGDSDFNDTVLGVAETVSQPLDALIGVPLTTADATFTIHVTFVDGAGNESDEFDFDSATTGVQGLVVTLDRTAPSAATSFTLTGRLGDGTTSTSTAVSQNVDVSFGSAPDVVAAFVTEAATFTGLQARPIADVTGNPFVLSSGDGSKTVRARLVDRAGNETTLSSTATITLDTAAPVILSFSLRDTTSNDATFTNAAAVTTALSVVTESGLEMRFVTPDNAADTESFVTFAASSSTTIEDVLAQDGLKSVVVQVRDAARNVASANASIFLDRVAPTLSTVSVAGGVASTRTQNVTVDINGANATKMTVTLRDTVAATSSTSPLLAFQPQILVTLPSGDCASCKEVEVTLFDDAGNASSAVTDAIGLDTVTPAGVSLVLASNATFTKTLTVATSLAFTVGATEAKQVALGEGIDCATATYASLAASSPDTTKTVTLTSDDGAKTVTACFKDTAGNISTAVDSILLDRTAPAGLTIRVAGGAAKTNLTSSVPVSVSIPTGVSDVSKVALADRTGLAALDCATATYVDIGTTVVTFNNATNQTKTVAACFEDAAGNRTATATTDDIVLDTTLDPAGVGFTVTGTPSSTATRTASVTVALSSLTAQAITSVQVSESATFADAAVLATGGAATLSLPFTLSAGDGTKTVRLRLIDDAGNADATRTATIVLDTTAPSDPVFANGNKTINASGSVVIAALAVASTDSGSGLRSTRGFDLVGLSSTLCTTLAGIVSGSAIANVSGRCEWNGTTPFTLNAADLSDGDTRLRVHGVDVAGNVSGDDIITITKDATAPGVTDLAAPIGGDQRISLAWTQPADAASFSVYYQVNPGSCPTTLGSYTADLAVEGASPIDIGLRSSFDLTGLDNNVELCVIVTATDAAGNEHTTASFGANNPSAVTPYELAPTTRANLTSTLLGITGSIGAMESRNGLLYVASAGKGLLEFDVSNEECFDLTNAAAFATCTKRIESTISGPKPVLSDPRDLVIHGGFAFVADAGTSQGLRVYRLVDGVSVDEEFNAISNFPGGSGISLAGAKALAVEGNNLAVLADAGVAIIDLNGLYDASPAIANSALLGKITSTDVTGTAVAGTSIDLQNDLLAVGGTSTKLLWNIAGLRATPATAIVEDVHDCTPTSPVATIRSVKLAGRFLYLTDTSNNLTACNMASGALGTVASSTLTSSANVELAGPYVVTAGAASLEVLDASDRAGLRFIGRHEATGTSADAIGPLTVDRTRAYYGSGGSVASGGGISVVDFTRGTTLERTVDDAAFTQGVAAVADDLYLNGLSTTALIGRDNLTAEGSPGVSGATHVEVENNTILSSVGTTFRLNRRGNTAALTTALTAASVPASDQILAFTARWPYLVALQANGTATRVVSYDMTTWTSTVAPTVVTTVTLTTSTAVTAGEASIAFEHGAIYVAANSSDANRGLYRIPLNSLTGVLGSAGRVVNDVVVGSFGHGHRLFFWTSNGSLKAQDLRTLETFLTPVTTAVQAGSVVSGVPKAIGSTIYIPRTTEISVVDIDYDASSVVASARKRTRFGGLDIRNVDLFGDKMLISASARATTIVTLR